MTAPGAKPLGEGWHNNHRYQSSTHNGFYWWEIDPTYYGLTMLSSSLGPSRRYSLLIRPLWQSTRVCMRET